MTIMNEENTKPDGTESDPKTKDIENPPFKPKRKHPSFMQNVREYFTEYCNNTGIHGFKYIGEQERTVFER